MSHLAEAPGEDAVSDSDAAVAGPADSDRTTLPVSRGQAKTGYDVARKKLDRLMSKPDQPVQLPGMKKERKPREPWQFVRNIWGSSAGVGSGDFHIYRGIRRREFERQEYMERKDAEDQARLEFEAKVATSEAQLSTQRAKKRAKRQKKKAKAKEARQKKKAKVEGEGETGGVGGSSEDSSDGGDSTGEPADKKGN